MTAFPWPSVSGAPALSCAACSCLLLLPANDGKEGVVGQGPGLMKAAAWVGRAADLLRGQGRRPEFDGSVSVFARERERVGGVRTGLLVLSPTRERLGPA